MLSFTLMAELGTNETFRLRTAMAVNIYAHQVLAESTDFPNHILRVGMANRVLQMDRQGAMTFVDSVVSSPVIQSTGAQKQEDISDQDIVNGVSQIWNSLIGITEAALGGAGPLPTTHAVMVEHQHE